MIPLGDGMDTFALAMALLWTLAEGAILVAMRWCLATLERRPARRRVLAKLDVAEGSSARWLGYLALLADAQGDRDRFRRAYTTYLGPLARPPRPHR